MFTYSLLLFAVILAVVSSTTTTLRGTQDQLQLQLQDQDQEQEQRHHRRLLEEVTCKLFLQDVTYKPTEAQPNGYSEQEWVCEFPPDQIERVGMYYAGISDHSFPNATSGETTLSISQAIIDTQSARMYLPSDAKMEVKTIRDRDLQKSNKRNLSAKTIGTLNTIMLRVIDSNGNGPTHSLEQLLNDVFEDESCLKSQYEACSYNKLKIQPYSDSKVANGVYDLEVDFDFTQAPDRTMLLNQARKEFDAQFGSINDKDNFDIVMFCMPPGEESNWGAFAYVNHPVSVYSNDWCGFVSAQMHEVGHSLNLEHSGKEEVVMDEFSQYQDATGLMGTSYSKDDQQLCFNPAKNWQLGWYEDQSQTIDPLDNTNDPVRRFVLNGVADYQQNPEALVVLRLEQDAMVSDYYIGYNRKTGINADTGEDGDMVTILRKDTAPDQIGISWKVAKLFVGDSYVIENFNNQRDVEIRFFGSQGMRDAIVDIIDVDHAPEDELADPCETHTVEVQTDDYPGDTSWTIVETTDLGRAFGSSPDYDEKLKLYSTEICLPYNGNYKFAILDSYGDGLCCSQGNGFYRIVDSDGNEVLAGAKDFKKEEKIVKVGANPNPPSPVSSPTKAPTRSPTKSPTKIPTKIPTKSPTKSPTDNDNSDSCENYTIEITTDDFPEDTSWSILKDTVEVYSQANALADKRTTYKTQVCLRYSTKYEFIMLDSFKDGLCCGSGQGSYKVTDSQGNTIVDSANTDETFHIKQITIEVPEISIDAPAPICKDKNGRFKIKTNGKKKTCKFYAKRNKCNRKANGVRIWQLCPVSCNKCDDL